MIREIGNKKGDAVYASDFRDALVKDKKQAEFLLFESFPVDMIESIGAINRTAATTAYAENLRHVLSLLNGHYITGYDDHVDSPEKPIEVINGSISEGEEFLRNHAPTLDRFNRVCKLINGFESPFGMELLSTVHWVAMHEDAVDKAQATELIYKWNKRKRMFATSGLLGKH